MPSALQKTCFSASTLGRGILITATSDPGTLIHSATGTAASGTWDEIFLYFHNPGTGNQSGNVEFGGNTSPGDILTYVVPGQSTVEVIPGFILNSGVLVKGYCQTANGLIAHGYINRITQ